MSVAQLANRVTGVDVRPEIIQVAKEVRKLEIPEAAADFFVQDWKTFEPPLADRHKFDVVLCTGLLHYFPREEYTEMVAKLGYVCGGKLVLEMKVKQDIDDKPRFFGGTKEGSTIPTFKWLKWLLLTSGFYLEHRIFGDSWPEGGGKGREIWVLRKLPEVPYQPSWPKGYEPGDIVEVPIDHPVFNYYYDTVERSLAYWWAWVCLAADNFKPWLFFPLVYQRSRKGMSDGGHRIMVAKRREMKTVRVRIM